MYCKAWSCEKIRVFSALSHSVVWWQHRPGRGEKLSVNRRSGEARRGNKNMMIQGTAFHNILFLAFNMLTKSRVQIPANIKLPCNSNENKNLKTQTQTCSGRN